MCALFLKNIVLTIKISILGFFVIGANIIVITYIIFQNTFYREYFNFSYSFSSSISKRLNLLMNIFIYFNIYANIS